VCLGNGWWLLQVEKSPVKVRRVKTIGFTVSQSRGASKTYVEVTTDTVIHSSSTTSDDQKVSVAKSDTSDMQTFSVTESVASEVETISVTKSLDISLEASQITVSVGTFYHCPVEVTLHGEEITHGCTVKHRQRETEGDCYVRAAACLYFYYNITTTSVHRFVSCSIVRLWKPNLRFRW